MLIGEYEGKITEKNRLAVPARVRSEFKSGLIVSRGYEGCLLLLDGTRWKQLIEVVTAKPLLQMSIRDTMRFLVGGAHQVELDAQGRFVIPSSLKDYAELDQDVVFVSVLDWVEIWDRQRWLTKLSDLAGSASDIAERLMQDYEK
ncbi:MAG: Protein MraZ [candidate division WS6 bacterium OLB20]|uniref:Transcriptional regulator MraZ n=1 Tax=candidate division WS6 bacterium OLB20 TaxID=1617426 RepID=A0A136M0H7_9BACT|nr:MAG: Protein MraZ [candidate division WS6 bacterium OLB20]